MFLFFFFTFLFQQRFIFLISNFGDAKDSSKCSAEYEVIRNERGLIFWIFSLLKSCQLAEGCHKMMIPQCRLNCSLITLMCDLTVEGTLLWDDVTISNNIAYK